MSYSSFTRGELTAFITATPNAVWAPGIAHRANEPAVAHLLPLVGAEQVDPRQTQLRRGATQVGEGDRAVRPAASGLLESSRIALKGSAWPSPGFSLGIQGARREQSEQRAPPHQNSSR